MRRLGIGAVVLSSLVLVAPGASAATSRRLAGEDRYATAVAVAFDRWNAGGPSDVFLASGRDPADALAGSFGSGLHSSPVLLTEPDALPAVTLEALRRLAPTRVRILGGTASVGPAVESQLTAEGWIVERHAGADRYGTAAAVARSEGAAIVGAWREEGPTALLANGHRPFDALAAGPLAAGQLFPILLTQADALPAVTAQALDDLGIRHVIALGGTAAIGDGVVDALRASGRSVRRVSGIDRTATAAAVADLLVELGLEVTRASLASASSPMDALGAGPWAAPRTPVLLCQTPAYCGPSTSEWAHTHDLEEVVAIGGTAAVSDAALAEVAAGTG